VDLQQKFLEIRRRIALDLQKRQGERTRLLDTPPPHPKVPPVKPKSSGPKSDATVRKARDTTPIKKKASEGKKKNPKSTKAENKRKPRKSVPQPDTLKIPAQPVACSGAIETTHSLGWDAKNGTSLHEDTTAPIETISNAPNLTTGVEIREALLNATNPHLRQNSSASLNIRNGKPASGRTAERIGSDESISKSNKVGLTYGSLKDVIKSWAQKKISGHDTSIKETLAKNEIRPSVATMQPMRIAKSRRARMVARLKVRKLPGRVFRQCASGGVRKISNWIIRKYHSPLRKPKYSLAQKLERKLPVSNLLTKGGLVDKSQDGLIPMETRKKEKSKSNVRRISPLKVRRVALKNNPASDPAHRLIEQEDEASHAHERPKVVSPVKRSSRRLPKKDAYQSAISNSRIQTVKAEELRIERRCYLF
jgi:hypothetical protein